MQSIKLDGSAWASKYARGGSARKLSARKFYIVVDALQGHITSNGQCSPTPVKYLDVCITINCICQELYLCRICAISTSQGPGTAEKCRGDKGTACTWLVGEQL